MPGKAETHEALTVCCGFPRALSVLFSPYEMWPLFILFKKIIAWGSYCKSPRILNGMRLGTHLCTPKILRVMSLAAIMNMF